MQARTDSRSTRVSRPLRQGPYREPAYHEPASLVGPFVGTNSLLEPDGTIKRHVDRRISGNWRRPRLCVCSNFCPSPISNHRWRSCILLVASSFRSLGAPTVFRRWRPQPKSPRKITQNPSMSLDASEFARQLTIDQSNSNSCQTAVCALMVVFFGGNGQFPFDGPEFDGGHLT
jgi:hypothetical protein